ncbi:MAG: hypothetical protein ABIG67_05575 [Pseudomonadota bacterium]
MYYPDPLRKEGYGRKFTQLEDFSQDKKFRLDPLQKTGKISGTPQEFFLEPALIEVDG